jgi:hypothetical protein
LTQVPGSSGKIQLAIAEPEPNTNGPIELKHKTTNKYLIFIIILLKFDQKFTNLYFKVKANLRRI